MTLPAVTLLFVTTPKRNLAAPAGAVASSSNRTHSPGATSNWSPMVLETSDPSDVSHCTRRRTPPMFVLDRSQARNTYRSPGRVEGAVDVSFDQKLIAPVEPVRWALSDCSPRRFWAVETLTGDSGIPWTQLPTPLSYVPSTRFR